MMGSCLSTPCCDLSVILNDASDPMASTVLHLLEHHAAFVTEFLRGSLRLRLFRRAIRQFDDPLAAPFTVCTRGVNLVRERQGDMSAAHRSAFIDVFDDRAFDGVAVGG